jgi:hypothetical protein
MARLHDGRAAEAEALLSELRAAVESDEYARPLEARLDVARGRAIALLAPPNGEQGSWKQVQRDRVTVTAENVEAEFARLAALLKGDGGRRRLILAWVLEQEEGTS